MIIDDIFEKYNIQYGVDDEINLFLDIGEINGIRQKLYLNELDIADLNCVLEGLSDNYFISDDKLQVIKLDESVWNTSNDRSAEFLFKIDSVEMYCSVDDMWLMCFYMRKYLDKCFYPGMEI